MILIDLIVLDHFNDDHNRFVLGINLEFVRLSLHLQLADYVLSLLLSARCEGTDVDVEELVGETGEEEAVALEFEVLFEVFCGADYAVVVAGIQEVGGLLQVLRFVEVDDVLYAIDELREELNSSSKGLDVLVVMGDLQGENETSFLVADFLLDYFVEVGVEVLGHLISDYIRQLVALRLLFGDFELVEELVGHLDDSPFLNENVI